MNLLSIKDSAVLGLGAAYGGLMQILALHMDLMEHVGSVLVLFFSIFLYGTLAEQWTKWCCLLRQFWPLPNRLVHLHVIPRFAHITFNLYMPRHLCYTCCVLFAEWHSFHQIMELRFAKETWHRSRLFALISALCACYEAYLVLADEPNPVIQLIVLHLPMDWSRSQAMEIAGKEWIHCLTQAF